MSISSVCHTAWQCLTRARRLRMEAAYRIVITTASVRTVPMATHLARSAVFVQPDSQDQRVNKVSLRLFFPVLYCCLLSSRCRDCSVTGVVFSFYSLFLLFFIFVCCTHCKPVGGCIPLTKHGQPFIFYQWNEQLVFVTTVSKCCRVRLRVLCVN